MKLSIIVPIFNSEKFLKRSIESILNQNFDEMEILLINDGSTDRSLEICKEYEKHDKRVVVYNNMNKGCSYTRNFGIKNSKGKYITFIDSDDSYVEKNFLRDLIQLIDEQGLDLLEFGYNKINISGKIESQTPKKSYEKKSLYKQNKFFNNPVNKIYRRDLIIKNDIDFPLNCHMGEDMAFNFKYSYYAKKIIILDKNYYNYFENLGSASFSIEKRLEIFKAFDDIIHYFNTKGIKLPISELKSYYKFHAIKSSYILLANLFSDKKIINDYIKKIEIEQKKRNDFFKSNFFISNVYGMLRIKFCFIFKILKRIKAKI